MKTRHIKRISKPKRPAPRRLEEDVGKADFAARSQGAPTRTRRIIRGISKPVPSPVSIRLDEDARETLEAEAAARGIGLATLLRQIASEAAIRLHRERIRRQSKAVGDYVAGSREAAEFYEGWGTPRAEG